MSKYQEALDNAIREFEVDFKEDYCNEWLKNEIEGLKEVKNKLERLEEENAKYKTFAQETNFPLENAMFLFQVFKNKKFYYKSFGKIYECNNNYVANIYWGKNPNEAFINVSTNNRELAEEINDYDVRLFVEDFGFKWWLDKPEV